MKIVVVVVDFHSINMSKKFYMSNRNLVWENLFLFKIRPTLYGRVDYFEA